MSGGEAVALPAIDAIVAVTIGGRVPHAIVQTAGPTLPELVRLRAQQPAAPEGGAGHGLLAPLPMSDPRGFDIRPATATMKFAAPGTG